MYGASVMKRVSWSAGWGGFYLIGGHGAKCRPSAFFPLPLWERVPSRSEGGGGVCHRGERPLIRHGLRPRHLLPQGEKEEREKEERDRASSLPRPCRGHREQQPARDQQRAA